MPASSVLALSSSRVGNSGYLENALPMIKDFLGNGPLKIAFVPFATADNNYEDYFSKVREGLAMLPHNIEVVTPENAVLIIQDAQAIMVGGGNTFKLLHDLYKLEVLELIKKKVAEGTPYVGWSAGANITGRTIATTNDMPIIEPKSFAALAFFPFQINPHYLNVKPEGHNGETRDERLAEFLTINPQVPVVGLPEGTALKLSDNRLTLIGDRPAVLFHSEANHKIVRSEIDINSDLSYLL